ncbi:MAG TPA: valine--tRNA ligase [Corynebacteriales bacterium]|nr:valine--tRNA ligase [Mycobacteriales bacterium]
MATNSIDRSGELPKQWDPTAVESDMYQRWVDAGYFHADVNSSKPTYTIVLPPPNVTGKLHMGHALDHTLMDALCRRKRMQGYEVLWLPGMDHAGIATQSKVEQSLAEQGIDYHSLSRDEFMEKAWEWKNEFGGQIAEQMRAIGDGLDWERERFTLDEGLSRAVQTIFKRLYDAGLIYRAERLVNWSPVLKTAISDIEVNYEDVEGELVYFAYGEIGDDGKPVEGNSLVVATTRMETMLGDVGIAVHPDDERYQHLVGKKFPHPLRDDLELLVVADDYVDMEFGTGAVKITPAHDPNDFAMGQRHDLPMINIMDESANIAHTGTRFDGLTREEARPALTEALREQGRIIKEERPYVHSVGHSDRSGEAIEPRLSLQWFVKVDSMAKMAGDAIREGKTVIHPKSQEPRWFEWVDNMHDWCISRQLKWGHRIPIWYGPEGEIECVVDGEEPPAGYVQDEDVLDTWFSSALWPFSTMGWPDRTEDIKRFYPTDVLVTGYDILFFWVARMMMFAGFVGKEGAEGKDAGDIGPIPFTDVFLHGLVRDQQGRKMSKSLGNGIDPLDWVARFGADALRFTLARGANPGADIPVGDDNAQASRNFATKLFNATRFALMNGAEVGELPDRADMTDADRWILDRLEEVRADVDTGMENYEFAKACEALYHFTWDEFCDWYVELAKVQLGRHDEVLPTTEGTRYVLGYVLDTLLRLLHPVMPFVTEALWTTLTGEESLVIADWPDAYEAETDPVAKRRIDDMQKLVTEVRRFRADQGVKPSQRVPAKLIKVAEEADLAGQIASIRSLARLEEPEADFSATASLEVRLSQATVVVELDTSDTVDIAAERKRLEKDLKNAEKELETTGKKLANPNFLEKAPEAVVNKIRTRREVAEAEVKRLNERLAGLPQQN